MQTYQFTAFRDERYAASGEVQAESPEEAKAKIIERYYDEELVFCDYVDGGEPDQIMLTDEAGEEHHLEDETPPDVLKTLKALIDLIVAIDGATDRFEAEVTALGEATSAAEKAMQAAGVRHDIARKPDCARRLCADFKDFPEHIRRSCRHRSALPCEFPRQDRQDCQE